MTPFGYTTAQACALTGYAFNDLQYRAVHGIIPPSIRPGARGGSDGSRCRLWSAQDIVALRVDRLLDYGAGGGPSWLPAAVRLIQATPLEQLSGRCLVVENGHAHLLTEDETVWYLERSGARLITVVGLDQCLTMLFDPAGLAS